METRATVVTGLWTKRVARIGALCALLAAVPAAARADIVFPSVVCWLSAAGPYSFFLLPIVVTVPLLVAISAIEALIVRRVLKPPSGLGRLIAVLFLINVFTSAIGLVTMPSGTELFPGVLLAFAATTVVEGFCLVILLERGKRRLSLALFRASALMNAASYAFLGLLLALLIYLPAALMPNDLDKRALTGEIAVLDYKGNTDAVVSLPSGRLSSSPSRGVAPPEPMHKVVFVDGKRCVVRKADGKRIGAIPGGPYHDCWEVSDDGRYYANYLANSDTVVVGDCTTGTRREFKPVEGWDLCERTGKVALMHVSRITVYDPASKKSQELQLPGFDRSSEGPIWSPDGKYLAYTAVVSPYTQTVGATCPDALRAVSLDGRSATLARSEHAFSACDELLWVAER